MKVGASGAFDFLKANAGAAALAAGTAISRVLRDAGGRQRSRRRRSAPASSRIPSRLTAEEASRLQEVAGDLGIGVEHPSSRR